MRPKRWIIFICVLSLFVLAKHSLASTQGFPDALSGWGTNATQDITQYAPISYIDSASQRFAWASIEPQQGQYNWTGVDSFIDPLIARGKKVAVGIMWKGRYLGPGQNNGCGGPNTSNCIDGTPSWILGSSYDPVISLNDPHPMINFLDTNVQNAMRQTTKVFVDHIKSKYGDNSNIAFLVCTGMDCEAQPEDRDSSGNRTDQAYIDEWASGNVGAAVDQWIDFVSFLVDMSDSEINSQYPDKTRYLVISANFKDGIKEKNAYADIIKNKRNIWGLYTAAISTGYDGSHYSQPHNQSQDEILSNNGDIQDLLRRFCLTRPCLGEHGDAGAYDTSDWKQWWRATSALWQRVDGFMTRGPWIPISQQARQFFNTYATKSYFNTPQAWVALHEDYIQQPSNLKQRNFTFYLDQFDNGSIDGKNGTTTPNWSGFNGSPLIGGDYRGAFVRNTGPGNIMAFRAIADANNNYFISGGPHSIDLTITYLDNGNDSLSLYYNSPQGVKEAWSINKANTGGWIDKSVRVDDAMFNQGIPGGADFYIDDNDGAETIHWASVAYANANPNPTPTLPPPFTPQPTQPGTTVTINPTPTPLITNLTVGPTPGPLIALVANSTFTLTGNSQPISVSFQPQLTNNSSFSIIKNSDTPLAANSSNNYTVTFQNVNNNTSFQVLGANVNAQFSLTNVNDPPQDVTLQITNSSTTPTPGSFIGSIVPTITSPAGLFLIVIFLFILDFFVKPEKIL